MSSDIPKQNLTSPFDLNDDGYVWLKGNLHSHTTNSDGKPEPQERVDGYVNQGYDFLCVSDHYKITRTDTLTAPDNFVLVQGAELHPENPFGGQTHHPGTLGDVLAERRVEINAMVHRNVSHVLNTATDEKLALSGHHRHCCVLDCRQ